MSVFYRCDAESCGKKAIGAFDGYEWQPPQGWRSRSLSDWQVHACSDKCLDSVLADKSVNTPSTSTANGIRVDTPPPKGT